MPHGPKGNGQAWRVSGTPSRVGPPSRNPDGQRRPSRRRLGRAMPQAIKLIDAEGRSCIYVPDHGKTARWSIAKGMRWNWTTNDRPTMQTAFLRQQSPNRPQQRDPDREESHKLQILKNKASTTRHDGSALENSERGLPCSPV
jgi:hypothetical protein